MDAESKERIIFRFSLAPYPNTNLTKPMATG